MSRPRLIALLLLLVTLAVYLPVVRHGFILYDDGDYVSENKMVQGGLTFADVKWAFTTFHSANWHPLTWLSHMADCQVFGLDAAGHHSVNALLHTTNAVLLFVLLLRLSRLRTPAPQDRKEAVWPCAFIAALFALHPLHVESVAWVAERKDVLCAAFGLLTLLCYEHYAAEGEGWQVARSYRLRFYWLALLSFACGLMSKPMVVTLPFVMLLLDYWPLGRFTVAPKPGEVGFVTLKRPSDREPRKLSGLLIEKIPFFLLATASCAVTVLAQNRGAIKSLAAVPLDYRLENAPVAVATYLFKMIWPTRLAVIYPMPHSIAPAAFLSCTAVLAAITAAAWLARRQVPFLMVGWFWFLGMLIPVLGLVKVGNAAMADRYTYLPSIGIFMAVAFGAEWLFFNLSANRTPETRRFMKRSLAATAILILGALAFLTERQLQFWRNDESLFRHALHVTPDNVDAYINYGVALENNGHPLEAMAQYRRAEKLAPSSYQVCADLGNLLYYEGKSEEALQEYQRAVKLRPQLAALHDRLGTVLASLGHFPEATNEIAQAIRSDPDDVSSRVDFGSILAMRGNLAGATNAFNEAMRLAPTDPSPLVEWGKTLLKAGRDADAINQFRRALELDPDNFQTLTLTARVFAADKLPAIRDGSTALALAQKANDLTGGKQPLVEDALGMARAETGNFGEAQQAARAAIRLAVAAGMKDEIITAMRQRLALYEKGQPWRESFLTTNGAEAFRH